MLPTWTGRFPSSKHWIRARPESSNCVSTWDLQRWKPPKYWESPRPPWIGTSRWPAPGSAANCGRTSRRRSPQRPAGSMNQTTREAGNSDWNRIEELFHAALEVPSAERKGWLEARTSGQPGIRHEVLSLLAGQQKHEELSHTESALDRPANDFDQRLLGEFCGPYRLDGLIGHGGVGSGYGGVRG